MADEVEKPVRVLPRVTPDTEHFWRGGEQGELRFLRCAECGHWIHPPAPVCPVDLSKNLEVEAVSGKAFVHTYTVNHHPWMPGFDPPYVVAIVELPEQAGLRLTTNVVNCDPDEIEVGMPVRVTFEQYEDVWLPLFEPDRDGKARDA